MRRLEVVGKACTPYTNGCHWTLGGLKLEEEVQVLFWVQQSQRSQVVGMKSWPEGRPLGCSVLERI